MFRRFIASIADYAIYTISPEGLMTSWNAGVERFIGYAQDEFVGRSFSSLCTEEDQAVARPAEVLRLAAREPYESEASWVRKDGTQFWAEFTITPIRSTDRKLLGFTNVMRDITNRRTDQEAQHRTEEQFRLLVQSVTDYAIFMLSPDGIVTNWNAGAERIKGYTAEEIVGSHFSRFYTDDEKAQGLPQRALELAAKDGRYEREGWRLRKDGSRFLANVVIDPIRDIDGTLIGYAKVTRDVTERREAEQALSRTKDELFQSQKLDAIGKLTGGVAHDFNNLLNVIVNGLDLLRTEPERPIQQRAIETMRRAADRGAALTRQLLTFARQQPFSPTQVQLRKTISEFEPVLRRALPSSITLEISMSPKLPLVLVDAAQVEVALLNLVVNARDAIEGRGQIVLEADILDGIPAGSALPQGQYVHVSVRDNGCGMSEEVRQRALEPFFTTKPIGQGTGLGLSQAYGLIQQAKGHITIVSDPGNGTTVGMYFPALSSGELDATTADAAEKVLVVDDQPEVLDMAAHLFRSLGYDVLCATNGSDALEKLSAHRDVAILFSDIVMPGMTGVELAKAARTQLPDLKVILASGYIASSLREQHSELENFDIMQKPYRLSDLIKKLKSVHA
jgi:PAS domain S-box-containing protein